MDPPQKKVVVESKVKGPKRLGQGARGVGQGKKKHHQTVDSDDIEEPSGRRRCATATRSSLFDDRNSRRWSWCTDGSLFGKLHQIDREYRLIHVLDPLLEILYEESDRSAAKTSIKPSIVLRRTTVRYSSLIFIICLYFFALLVVTSGRESFITFLINVNRTTSSRLSNKW